MKNRGKLIIFSAPSGSGKSTLIRYLLERDLNLKFSVSATSRPPREEEVEGIDYYFLTTEQFREKIDNNEFLEYEEVYKGTFYGTLKSEVDKLLLEGYNVVFDVDCVGGISIKKIYGDKALSIFVMPPSIEELRKRLEKRGTESPEVIDKRLAKAEYEMSFADKSDHIVMNDDYDRAKAETVELIRNFISDNR